METKSKHPHYYKDVSKLQVIDVYRVLQLFNVSDPCIQHAVKKLLVAGGRGAGKDITKDISEAIDSLERWEEMDRENNIPSLLTVNVSNTTSLVSSVQAESRQASSKTLDSAMPPQSPFVSRDLLQQAHNRIYDLLIGDEGQAVKEAERYLERNDPTLWANYQAYYSTTRK